jgi:hypothetical protein
MQLPIFDQAINVATRRCPVPPGDLGPITVRGDRPPPPNVRSQTRSVRQVADLGFLVPLIWMGETQDDRESTDPDPSPSRCPISTARVRDPSPLSTARRRSVTCAITRTPLITHRVERRTSSLVMKRIGFVALFAAAMWPWNDPIRRDASRHPYRRLMPRPRAAQKVGQRSLPHAAGEVGSGNVLLPGPRHIVPMASAVVRRLRGRW